MRVDLYQVFKNFTVEDISKTPSRAANFEQTSLQIMFNNIQSFKYKADLQNQTATQSNLSHKRNRKWVSL